MKYHFIKFGDAGYPLFYYDEITYPPVVDDDGKPTATNLDIPEDAKPVTEQQWLDAQVMRLWLSPTGEITVPPEINLIPTASDVDQERDRRTAGGFSFGGFFYQSRPEDRENIAGAATAALAAMVNGAQPGDYRWHGGESDFEWIAADNTTHFLDAQSTFAMGQAAMKHKQDHIFAARALKDADQIPADFTDNSHWPTP